MQKKDYTIPASRVIDISAFCRDSGSFDQDSDGTVKDGDDIIGNTRPFEFEWE